MSLKNMVHGCPNTDHEQLCEHAKLAVNKSCIYLNRKSVPRQLIELTDNIKHINVFYSSLSCYMNSRQNTKIFGGFRSLT
jgi:hypothetical protein